MLGLTSLVISCILLRQFEKKMEKRLKILIVTRRHLVRGTT